MKAKSLSCVRLFVTHMDCSLPGSSVHGIFQARVPEWVAISFSRGSSPLRDRTQVSHIAGRHFTLWATREALGWQQTLKIWFSGRSMWWARSLRDIKELFFFFLPLFCLFVLQLYWKEGHIAMLTTVMQCFCTYFWPITKGIKLDTRSFLSAIENSLYLSM